MASDFRLIADKTEKIGHATDVVSYYSFSDTSSSFAPGNYRKSNQDNEHSDIQYQPVRGDSNVEIIYRVVFSRTPVLRSKGWRPERNFLERSLQELVQELPIKGHINALVFTLEVSHTRSEPPQEGPDVHVEEQINHNETNRFEAMKRYFNSIIRECISKHSDPKSMLVVEIEIEAQGLEKTTIDEAVETEEIGW